MTTVDPASFVFGLFIGGGGGHRNNLVSVFLSQTGVAETMTYHAWLIATGLSGGAALALPLRSPWKIVAAIAFAGFFVYGTIAH